MEQSRARVVKFAQTAGSAECAQIGVGNLAADVQLRLGKEEFANSLFTELKQIEGRIEEIAGDLHSLAFAKNPDAGWEVEHHRLANQGAMPEKEAPAAA